MAKAIGSISLKVKNTVLQKIEDYMNPYDHTNSADYNFTNVVSIIELSSKSIALRIGRMIQKNYGFNFNGVKLTAMHYEHNLESNFGTVDLKLLFEDAESLERFVSQNFDLILTGESIDAHLIFKTTIHGEECYIP